MPPGWDRITSPPLHQRDRWQQSASARCCRVNLAALAVDSTRQDHPSALGGAMKPITLTDLPYSGNSYELEGVHYDGVPASLIFFNGPPGSGPRLHSHPYAELFVIQE